MTKAIYERLVPMEMLMDGTSMEPSIINDTERNNPRIPCESTTTVFPQPVVESSETERISQALNSSQRAESSINANYFAQFSTGTSDNISELGNVCTPTVLEEIPSSSKLIPLYSQIGNTMVSK